MHNLQQRGICKLIVKTFAIAKSKISKFWISLNETQNFAVNFQ
jgi:hypothetical protein